MPFGMDENSKSQGTSPRVGEDVESAADLSAPKKFMKGIEASKISFSKEGKIAVASCFALPAFTFFGLIAYLQFLAMSSFTIGDVPAPDAVALDSFAPAHAVLVLQATVKDPEAFKERLGKNTKDQKAMVLLAPYIFGNLPHKAELTGAVEVEVVPHFTKLNPFVGLQVSSTEVSASGTSARSLSVVRKGRKGGLQPDSLTEKQTPEAPSSSLSELSEEAEFKHPKVNVHLPVKITHKDSSTMSYLLDGFAQPSDSEAGKRHSEHLRDNLAPKLKKLFPEILGARVSFSAEFTTEVRHDMSGGQGFMCQGMMARVLDTNKEELVEHLKEQLPLATHVTGKVHGGEMSLKVRMPWTKSLSALRCHAQSRVHTGLANFVSGLPGKVEGSTSGLCKAATDEKQLPMALVHSGDRTFYPKSKEWAQAADNADKCTNQDYKMAVRGAMSTLVF